MEDLLGRPRLQGPGAPWPVVAGRMALPSAAAGGPAGNSPVGKHGRGLATIIFSSGSTGTPKGVMLTHKNIQANVEGLAQVLQVWPQDRLMASLPLFHSLGTTGGIWFPLGCGFAALYHPNPLDAPAIGRLAQRQVPRPAILLSTPTFSQTPTCRKIPAPAVRPPALRRGGRREAARAPGPGLQGALWRGPAGEGYGCAPRWPPWWRSTCRTYDEGGEHHVGHKAGTIEGPPARCGGHRWWIWTAVSRAAHGPERPAAAQRRQTAWPATGNFAPT